MVSVFFRTILIYLFLLLTMRLMGKRQVGELQVSELIVTFMLSELAANPISNPSMPLLHAFIPILLLLSIEVTLSFWMTKSNKMKRILSGSPTVLIRRGKLDQKAMLENRLEIDELLSEMRLAGIPDPAMVEYAILEENGRLSVFPKAEFAPVTPHDIHRDTTESGIAHPLIIDGQIQPSALRTTGRNEDWLQKRLKEQGLTKEQVFLLTIDDAGETFCIPKEEGES